MHALPSAKRASFPGAKKVMRIRVVDKVPGARLGTAPMSPRSPQRPAIQNPFFNFKPFQAPNLIRTPKDVASNTDVTSQTSTQQPLRFL